MNAWDTLVESTIDSIYFDPSKSELVIEVTCPFEKGLRKRLIAKGVDDLIFNEMRLANIIDRVSQFVEDDFLGEDAVGVRKLSFLMRGKDATPSDFKWPELQRKLARVRSGELSLIEIEPVYGAIALVLASEFSLVPLERGGKG